MKVVFRRSFVRDLRTIGDGKLREHVERIVAQVEQADALRDLPNVIAMQGHSTAFRIRVGTYRIGLYRDGDTIEFVRFLHRRDVYRYFP